MSWKESLVVVGSNTSASVIVSRLEFVFTIVAPLPKVISLGSSPRSMLSNFSLPGADTNEGTLLPG